MISNLLLTLIILAVLLFIWLLWETILAAQEIKDRKDEHDE